MPEAIRPSVAAHVLRRTGFGPFPGQVTVAAAQPTIDALVDQRFEPVLPFAPSFDDPALPDGGPIDIDQPDSDVLRYHMHFRQWWVRRMERDDAALHEKLMWFWHGHFTTASSKVDSTNLCWRQLRTLHEHALGTFGDLVRAMTVDGAMLRYLDGDRSNAASPNENYGRELMELFTLGIGEFGQADVAAASRALAGYRVAEDLQVTFDPAAGLARPVRFLGTSGVKTVDDVVDVVLAHRACAPWIVGRLWASFIGGPPDRVLIRRWADRFRASGYQIRPLLEDLLHSDAFLHAGGSRARTGIEWYCAAVGAAGARDRRDPADDLVKLSQLPYAPPNVSGWPGDVAWLSTSHLRARAQLALDLGLATPPDLVPADPVPVAVERASLVEVSTETRRALVELDGSLRAASVAPQQRWAAVLAAVLLSPEFARS